MILLFAACTEDIGFYIRLKLRACIAILVLFRRKAAYDIIFFRFQGRGGEVPFLATPFLQAPVDEQQKCHQRLTRFEVKSEPWPAVWPVPHPPSVS